ncbi:UNVERIFIED_CONTAM: hypothetical protein FKN15_034334 [Acipenser sinensis]
MSYFNPERALAAPQDNGMASKLDVGEPQLPRKRKAPCRSEEDGVVQSRAPPLSPPPYVVVLISCSGVFSFVLLLLACMCCKRGGGFNEFDNTEGEECSEGEGSPAAEDSSSSQSLPEVYILPLSQVNHPSIQKGGGRQGFSRQNLSYLQEIGNGWFGKPSPAQAVVKELRVNAGPLEQRKFLTEAQPYRKQSSDWLEPTANDIAEDHRTSRDDDTESAPEAKEAGTLEEPPADDLTNGPPKLLIGPDAETTPTQPQHIQSMKGESGANAFLDDGLGGSSLQWEDEFPETKEAEPDLITSSRFTVIPAEDPPTLTETGQLN